MSEPSPIKNNKKGSTMWWLFVISLQYFVNQNKQRDQETDLFIKQLFLLGRAVL
jgi:hypothetical protein